MTSHIKKAMKNQEKGKVKVNGESSEFGSKTRINF